ncbi:MAG TPA: pyrroloquinoline quinone-dependent dehydrogenase [Longimicrobiales bacterium]|nr:pyrroloquinoline quinone-dependent dehydrogenase [Longimicrobiales bacterium]
MASLTRLCRSWFFVWVLIVSVLTLVAAGGGGRAVAAFVPGVAVGEWPTSDGEGGNHYSPLADITPETVSHLAVAWRYRTGDVHAHEDGFAGTAFQATPIMLDGTLYVATPYSRAIALDAETGEELWTFDPALDRSDRDHTQLTTRGLSHWRDEAARAGAPCAAKIFLAAFDGRLFALDAADGSPCVGFGEGGVVDLRQGVARIEGQRKHWHQTAPPAVIGDVVVLGSSISDSHVADAPSGVVRAYDARTGALVWAWEPLLGDVAEGVAVGAANAWATITADPERDLVFVPTGSPSPDHWGGLRPGDNRHANSLVALRASTGEVVWHFQTVHHDLWDYDLPSPPALVTVERNGVQVPAVVQTTKMGYVFVFHRETGEPLFPIAEVPVPASDVPGEVTSPTQPVPVLPRPLTPQGIGPEDAWGLTPIDRAACRRRIEAHRSDGVFAPPSLRGTVAYPGFIGGMEWGGVGYDPERALLVTNTNRVPMVATLIPREETGAGASDAEHGKFSVAPQEGTPYAVKREALLSPLGIPCSRPPWGMLHAVDLSTGALVWEVPLGRLSDITGVPTPMRWGSPNLGGPLVTGGLVFIGATMDRRLRAFDLSSGALLWTAELPASAQSSPLTYRARSGGRQFVVITAGGHSGMGSRLGDHIVAYALPAPLGEPGR